MRVIFDDRIAREQSFTKWPKQSVKPPFFTVLCFTQQHMRCLRNYMKLNLPEIPFRPGRDYTLSTPLRRTVHEDCLNCGVTNRVD